MPSPLSSTVSFASAPSRSRLSRIVPPFGVNFTALLSRFHATCCRRTESPSITRFSAGSLISRLSPLAAASFALSRGRRQLLRTGRLIHG